MSRIGNPFEISNVCTIFLTNHLFGNSSEMSKVAKFLTIYICQIYSNTIAYQFSNNIYLIKNSLNSFSRINSNWTNFKILMNLFEDFKLPYGTAYKKNLLRDRNFTQETVYNLYTIISHTIINGARLNFRYSNQNWHVAGSLIGPSRAHNCNNLK